MKPLVSIIIANWNGGNVFRDCVKSLSEIKYPKWELIVVDNGSSDGSQKLPLDFKLIQNKKNLGFAQANNQGFTQCKGKYIMLLNNDTKVNPDFLDVLVTKLETDSLVGVIQPKIYLMDKKGYLDNAGSYFTKIGFLKHRGFLKKDGEEYNTELEVFSVKGACMIIRKEVIEKIGLFDERFFSYFEESDFCWRVHLAGFKVLYYPKTFIYHKVGFTIKRLDVFDINYHYYKNRIRSLIKNLELSNLLLILSLHLIVSLGIALAFLVRLQPKNSFMVVNAMVWNLANLNDALKERSRIQKMRIVNDRQIFQKFEKPINWLEYLKDFRRIESDLKRG